MSFLSRLFGKTNKKETEQPAEIVKQEFVEEVTNFVEDTSCSSDLGQVNEIDSFITEDNFEGYTIERNVHPSRFDPDAHPSCFPISYLFKKEGQPVLAVLFMGTNQYRSMIARGTYKILKDKGIFFIRFFKSYENNKDYVIDRIKSYLA